MLHVPSSGSSTHKLVRPAYAILLSWLASLSRSRHFPFSPPPTATHSKATGQRLGGGVLETHGPMCMKFDEEAQMTSWPSLPEIQNQEIKFTLAVSLTCLVATDGKEGIAHSASSFIQDRNQASFYRSEASSSALSLIIQQTPKYSKRTLEG